MELRVKPYEAPPAIEFNFTELRNELLERAKVYETVVYDEEHIKDAKADRASLNKLKKALNDERIRRKREYLKPFEDFEAKVNEIISIIDKPCALIDRQVKEYEERIRADKELSICRMWNEEIEHPDWMRLDFIWSDRWLNASVFPLSSMTERHTATLWTSSARSPV